MALNWDVSKIKDFEEVCFLYHEDDGRRKVKGVTNALIWHTMLVGMGQITEKNYEKFFVRSQMAVRATRNYPVSAITEDGGYEHRGFTLAEIRAHIGLSTNASTDTKAKFKKRVVAWLEGDAELELRRQKERKEEAVQA